MEWEAAPSSRPLKLGAKGICVRGKRDGFLSIESSKSLLQSPAHRVLPLFQAVDTWEIVPNGIAQVIQDIAEVTVRESVPGELSVVQRRNPSGIASDERVPNVVGAQTSDKPLVCGRPYSTPKKVSMASLVDVDTIELRKVLEHAWHIDDGTRPIEGHGGWTELVEVNRVGAYVFLRLLDELSPAPLKPGKFDSRVRMPFRSTVLRPARSAP